MINITIHRGAHQIGGCATEITTENCKIIVDLGSNLPGSEAKEFSKEQVSRIVAGADALFYTHYHGDHVGLFPMVPQEIPQYIGPCAKEVMQCKYKALHKDEELSSIGEMRTYQEGQIIDVNEKNEILVTPYYISHSAFDAYMFRIECEGRTILHTGDFRGHGYLSKKLMEVLHRYVGKVDILITEGTMLGRPNERVLPEREVKVNIRNVLKDHKYTFALTSSTDMERLASFHAACKEIGRHFWVDAYQKNVLECFARHTKASLFNFDSVFQYNGHDSENVVREMKSKGFLMLVRTGHYQRVREMLDIYNEEPAYLIYSMWSGYAEVNKPYSNNAVLDFRHLFGSHIVDGTKDGVHTSGHADLHTLSEVCETVDPRIGIIPIHKDKDTRFSVVSGLGNYKLFTEEYQRIANINITLR